MKSIRILIFFLSITFCNVYSQQDPAISMYTVDKMLINPAFTGSSNWAVGTMKYRNNLSILGEKFSTQTVNFHTPIQSKHLGLGFKIINDKRILLNNLNLTMTASYHLNFAGGKLSFGLEGGIYNRKTSYDKLILLKKDDQVIPLNSPSSTVPDLAYGFYYQKRQFYIGYSMYHLLKSKFDNNTTTHTASHIYSNNYLLIGNIYDVSKYWALEPSLLIKYQPQSSLQMDVNLMICYDNRFSAGVQFHTGTGLGTAIKFNITESLKIAYSYERSISKFSNLSNGAHEIVISYGIKLPPPPTKKEIHPRYYF